MTTPCDLATAVTLSNIYFTRPIGSTGLMGARISNRKVSLPHPRLLLSDGELIHHHVEQSLLHTTDRVNGTDTFGGPDLQLEGFSAAPKASTQLMGSFCQAESTHRPRGAKERGKQAL